VFNSFGNINQTQL